MRVVLFLMGAALWLALGLPTTLALLFGSARVVSLAGLWLFSLYLGLGVLSYRLERLHRHQCWLLPLPLSVSALVMLAHPGECEPGITCLMALLAALLTLLHRHSPKRLRRSHLA
ncbi:hypothetical protein [Gallaecimonas sp. GXIMD4217]|uniref:hypothetical protein n=1 Tax=Gallaecimonas sp. GXIMD4217 TaxID=3131927 RepID=UPI00311B295F